MPKQLLNCRFCGLAHEMEPLQEGMIASCARCGSEIARRTRGSMHLTGALSLAALILYIPANVFPILRLEMYGLATENTVWSGCVRLWQDGDLIIAIVVFLASILVPLLKLGGLFFLVIATLMKSPRWRIARTWAYRTIDVVGRWAMLDVFVLAVLVSLVKLEKLATIIPGKGALAFTTVVLLTLLASQSFDPQLMWNKEETGL